MGKLSQWRNTLQNLTLPRSLQQALLNGITNENDDEINLVILQALEAKQHQTRFDQVFDLIVQLSQ